MRLWPGSVHNIQRFPLLLAPLVKNLQTRILLNMHTKLEKLHTQEIHLLMKVHPQLKSEIAYASVHHHIELYSRNSHTW